MVDRSTKEACLKAGDLAAIENRDNQVLNDWMNKRPDYTIVRLAEELKMSRPTLNNIFLLKKPLTEAVAKRINDHLGLDLWGVPHKQGLHRKDQRKRVVVYV